MSVEQILAKLVSFPVLGGESNLIIINWIKEYVIDKMDDSNNELYRTGPFIFKIFCILQRINEKKYFY